MSDNNNEMLEWDVLRWNEGHEISCKLVPIPMYPFVLTVIYLNVLPLSD